MDRAKFLKSLVVFASISVFHPAQKLFAAPKNNSEYVHRKTTIFFPKGKTFKNFQADLDLWMNRNAWISFIESYKKSGQLLSMSKDVTANSVTYSYTFNSKAAYESFEKSAHLNCKVDLAARKRLGYSENISEISQIA